MQLKLQNSHHNDMRMGRNKQTKLYLIENFIHKISNFKDRKKKLQKLQLLFVYLNIDSGKLI